MQTYLLSELHAVSAIVQSAVPKVPSAVTPGLGQNEVDTPTDEPSALKRRLIGLNSLIIVPVLIAPSFSN